jgi:bifunctional non-homologous end joining protein LigD
MAASRKTSAAKQPAAKQPAAKEPAAKKAAARQPAAPGKTADKRAAPAKTANQPAREPAGKRLASYEDKRDFAQTPEPSGKPGGRRTRAKSAEPGGKAGAPRFVVQRHRARRLHYDLRFEIDGVLVSWAVPKGPTLDPDVRHAAIHVEDHPIEYLDFEGVIPSGQYGGGDVTVWDTGTWEPHATDDPAAAVAAGDFHADLHGQKLHGRFILVRRGEPDRSGKEQWLLLHKHDEYAVKGWNPEDHPQSVLSGRTNDQVKADPDRMWRSDLPPSKASVAVNPSGAAQGGRARSTRRTIGGQGKGGQRKDGSADDKDGSGPDDKDGTGQSKSKPGQDKSWDGPSAAELAALDALGSGGTWEVFGRRLRLSNLDKELFPGRDGEPPMSKREFIAYAARIAPVILPYLAGRPLNMNRFPNGAGAPGFWHKQLPAHAPDWLPRWHNPDASAGRTTTYLVVDEPAALVWAANFGALEWHAWTSRADAPDRPTYALIDIDPGEATSWDDVLVLTRLHRTALDHLGVRGLPKVTGRRGIQIWIPIAPGPTSAETTAWVEQVSRAVGDVVPELVSWKWELRDRSGHARLDYTQNAGHKTLVAPYSPRPSAGAPVSAPIDWDELDDSSLRPDGFTIRNIFGRLAERGDLFRPVLDTNQVLPPIS